MDRKFKLPRDQFKRLVPSMGACYATDMITVEGKRVGYMYRQDAAWWEKFRSLTDGTCGYIQAIECCDDALSYSPN